MFQSFIKMTPDEKMLKAKTQMVSLYPFYSNIMYRMKFVRVTDDTILPTMGVSEYGVLYWNVDFVGKITTVNALIGVLVHEILHIVFLTFDRKGDKHHELWNIATDILNNFILAQSGFSLPNNIIGPAGTPMTFYTPTRYGNIEFTINGISFNLDVSDMTAESVYAKILNDIKDTDQWKNGDGDGEGEGSGSGGSGGVVGSNDGLDKHIEGGVGPDGEPDGSAKNSEGGDISKEHNKKHWKSAVRQASAIANAAGKGVGAVDRLLEDILNPKLNWKVLLYNYIVSEIPYDYTMSRPSRRSYATHTYMPSMLKENLELIVTVDTSGSISVADYTSFISEIMGICSISDNIRARLLFWDTEVDADNVHVITRNNRDMLKTVFPRGGGGTDIGAVRRYCEEQGIRSQLYVHLTDGYVYSMDDDTLGVGKHLCIITPSGTTSKLDEYATVIKLED